MLDESRVTQVPRQLHSSEAAGVAPRPGGTVVPIVSSDEL